MQKAQKPATAEKKQHKIAQLKKTLTPGTVVILLGGYYAGKRCVFLKQLPSGLCLVIGPYKINRVPLRRVNQRYLIATSTKVDISGVKIPENLNDAMFAKPVEKKEKKLQEEKKPEGKRVPLWKQRPKDFTCASPERKQIQKAIDAQVFDAVKKVEFMREYLAEKFGLKHTDAPHKMIF